VKRALVVLGLLALTASGCQLVNPIAPVGTPEAVRMRPAADVTWNRFQVHLDPTVMVWADESNVDLRAVVRAAFEHIEGALHGSPTSVSIAAGSYLPIPDIGIGGQTDRRTGEVRISMDSRRPTPVKDLLTIWIPVALAHELHHSRRILDGPGYGATLLDAMVTEGSAEAFVRESYPSAPTIPWVEPLSTVDKAAVWRRARTVLSAPDDLDLHQTWFVGGGSLPPWPGYRLGYEMVRRYLARHRRTTAAQLALIPSASIYAGSGFAQAMNQPKKHGPSV